MKNVHELTVEETAKKLTTSVEAGLSDAEAQHRLNQFGQNELEDRGAKNPLKILQEQLTAAMVIILIIAAAVSAFLGDYKNAVVITIIVILNASLGFFQEYKAETAMAALKKMAVPQVKVLRNSAEKIISAKELVPGDIVLIETGNKVPADGRLAECFNLKIQEAALTGESEAIEKDPSALSSDLVLGDRRNMAYMGTDVVHGRGTLIVQETGMRTELGRIATLLQHTAHELTPLQKRLDLLGKLLALAAAVIVAIVAIMGIFRGEDPKLIFMTAISMAVAAIPEGLPAVVTIALALGAQRMLKRRALIRKLPAVETLGSVTIICSDKTGTLTENKMAVSVLDIADKKINFSHSDRFEDPMFDLLLKAGALCNDAGETLGDPTEIALIVAAGKAGIHKRDLESKHPRVAELPFDSNRKRMSTVHSFKKYPFKGFEQIEHMMFTKGAIDSLLSICDKIWVKDRLEPLTESWRVRINRAHEQLAQDGMRVLGVGFRPLEDPFKKEKVHTLESNLVFIGMVGMIDPARSEVKQAVATCKHAGIRPVMITGDHPLTAQYIGKQLGISSAQILTGRDLEAMPAAELEKRARDVSIFARVSPEHKLKIVEALRKQGHIVAMTGDGVNDAPALKRSHIGVAMGITGTDVSKEAADIVLLDDNFATVIGAIEEGRIIFDNIRKFIHYLVTTNMAEILIMLAAPFLGMPLPLTPLQILWINLVTDGPAALALSLEPGERNVMSRAPYAPNASIFTGRMIKEIFAASFLMTAICLGSGFWLWKRGNPIWQTFIFVTLALSQMGQALALRSNRDSLFRIGVTSNKELLFAVILTVVLQISIVYLPVLQGIFKTAVLSWQELFLALSLSTVIFWCIEIEKFFVRKANSFQRR